ncbi:hypothetical protein GE061_001486 [Apolygus lucorum]|uniref:BRCT domain-containing protein n=1 Tax=Apolygus lucorum TaxID=248454 RepID=A0A8S9Y7H8_APOLU|nr:hypothetical protein GE061_001486 [Apolygus lucorum]
MTDPVPDPSPFPFFLDVHGCSLNFRLICSRSSKKTEYTTKLNKFGGVCKKSQGSRIILVFGALPCEQGHNRCDIHPPFSKEPAFQICWIDHCLKERDLLDIKAYLLNPSPEFAKINYIERMINGEYRPVEEQSNTQCHHYSNEFEMIQIANNLSAFDSRIKSCCQHILSMDESTGYCTKDIEGCDSTLSLTSISTMDNSDVLSSSGQPHNSESALVLHRSPKRSVDTLLQSTTKPLKSSVGCASNMATLLKAKETAQSRIPVTYSSSSESDVELPVAAKRRKEEAGQNLPVNNTETPKDSHDSSDASSGLEIGPPLNQLKSSVVRTDTRTPYTRGEEICILNYIIASKKFTGITSKNNIL